MSAHADPSLLLIPGLAGSTAGLARAARSIFAGFTLIPFDHRVGGVQDGIEGLAHRAAALLPVGQPAYVCGESFGGPVALTIARLYPERVRGLILLSTFGRHPTAGATHAQLLMAVWAQLIERLPLLARAARIAGIPGSFGRAVPWECVLAYVREPLLSGPEYQHRVALLGQFDARPWLHEVTCPAILIFGNRDPVVPPRAARELGRLLPDCTVRELPCGHLAYLALPDGIRVAVESWRSRVENVASV